MQTVSRKQAKRFKQLAAAGAITLTLAGSVMQAATPAFAADDDAATTAEAGGADDKGLKVTPDATALNKAVKDAEAAGVKVTTSDTKTTTVAAKDAATNKDRVEASYADKVKELQDLAAKQKAADDKYAKDSAAYKTALDAYNKAVKGQTGDANSANPLQPQKLDYEQPFDLTANKTGLSKVSATSTKITNKANIPAGDLYNSNYVLRIKVSDTTNPITITYKNVAKDKATGESLDVTLTLSDFVTDKIDTQGANGDAGSYIYAYSNYVDSVSQFNVVAMKQATSYSYSKSGKAYDKSFYQTFGSLNFQDDNRYEFTAPGDGVKATFLNEGTAIANKLQKVSGKAANKVSQAFMGQVGTQQPEGAWDTRPEALTQLGVTYLVDNGASVWLGVSGGDGKEPAGKVGDGGYWATYNHIMMGANTVAPTAVKPVEPKNPAVLKADVQMENLLVTPEVTKDVDAGTNTGNKDGSDDGKTFMVGDDMTFTFQATDLPAGREAYKTLAYTDKLPDGFKFADAKAYDKDGKDVSDQVKVTEKDDTLTVAFTDAAIKAINADTNKAVTLPTITVHGQAEKNGAKLTNVVTLAIDGQPFKSNNVEPVVKDIQVHKDVEAGMKDTATGESVNGKAVVKGQALTYELTTDDLPANRATNVTKFAWSDDLPKYVDYAGFKVVNAAGEDVTDQYEDNGDGKRKFAINLKSVDALNADKTQAYKTDTVLIYTNANQDGVNFKNTAKLALGTGDETDGKTHDKTTETVENRTPDYHPVKKDVDDKGNNVDGKNVKPVDTIHYDVIGDLSEMTDMTFSKDSITEKTFGLSDDYDETRLDVTDAVKKDFTIDLVKPEATTDQSTKAASSEGAATTAEKKAGDTIFSDKGTATKFDMADVNVKWDIEKGKWTVTPKNPLSFLQKYAGYELVAHFNPIVKADATGVIENVATQTTFGGDTVTNKVKNPLTPEKKATPAKPVEKKETPEQKAKQLPNTGSNGPLQRIVNWFMGLVK
ncbi:isopeptide-forming domain-containing fimbrial protein [Weissella confusa]|uniref:SspB-related isopeptide-forming adhesin n=1 Tax=Weissella confusa TaxID=1583 RepID=UPI0021AE6693|nr:SspB-related isopeptide-forming adhesin [Weissella confusa]MCS9992744.1 isopeptide-forming domain-containing fimbrial protein [Weissella confusa]